MDGNAIGKMRDTVSFYRLNSTTDLYGNATSGYASAPFLTRRGRLDVSGGGREDFEAGRNQSEVGATLVIRCDSGTETITEADKAVIGGTDYQIQSIRQIDRKGRWLHLALERGVAVTPEA